MSTNVVLATSPDMSETEFTLSLFSTPSNVVEVASGTDADLDGDISQEIALLNQKIRNDIIPSMRNANTTVVINNRWWWRLA